MRLWDKWLGVVGSVFNPMGFVGLFLILLPLSVGRYWYILAVVLIVFGIPALWMHAWWPIWPWGVLCYAVAICIANLATLGRFPNG